jgi:hypothetical protein
MSSALKLHVEATKNGEPLRGYPVDLILSAMDSLSITDDAGIEIKITASEPEEDLPDHE